MALLPARELSGVCLHIFDIGAVDAVFAGKVAVKLVVQRRELEAHLLLLFCYQFRVNVDGRLHGAEIVKSPLHLLRFLLDACHRIVEIQLTRDGAFGLGIGGETDERVPGTDIEIDVGQRLDGGKGL